MALKLNLGSGRFPLKGFVNLNEPDWVAESDIPFRDESVDAITVSHLLMYVREEDWPAFFAEAHRVLKPGGVMRVTEDDTAHPESTRPGLQPNALTATRPAFTLQVMLDAGFDAFLALPLATTYPDGSLIQRWHGDPPDVFHCEGIKL